MTGADDVSVEQFYCVKGGMLYTIGMGSVEADDAEVMLESFVSLNEEATLPEPTYEAWKLAVSGIQVNRSGQAVALNPVVQLSLGIDETQYNARAELAICLETEQIITLELEYANGSLRYSVAGAKGYVVMDDADYMIGMYSRIYGLEDGLLVADALATLSALFENPAVLKQALSAMAPEMFRIETQPDGIYSFAVNVDNIAVTGQLSLQELGITNKPFSFEERTAEAFAPKNGFLGGADIAEATQAGGLPALQRGKGTFRSGGHPGRGIAPCAGTFHSIASFFDGCKIVSPEWRGN